MLRRFLFLIAVLVIFFPGLPAQAGKDKQIVFGPVYCEIDGDGVHFSVHELDMDRRGKGVIVITNNTPQIKIKDGFIRLDKKLKSHKKQKDYKKKKQKGSIRLGKYLGGHKNKSLEKKIDFKDAKYLTVYLKGTPKASITVEIRGKGRASSQNEPPVADDQAISIDEDTAVAITLTATDADGDSLTYAVTALPDHGTLSGTAPGLTYTPGENYHGNDSFSFNVNDGNLTGNTAMVSLTIDDVNDAPVAVAGSDQTVFVGDTVSLNGGGSNDVDGDSLSYQWSFSPALAGSTAALSDSLIVNPSFVPDIAGTYAVQLIVNDGTADSASDTVVIKAAPRMIAVPDVVGQIQADAKAALISANLTVGTISTAYSDTVPAERVISQAPAAGASIVEGSAVDLVVSLGPENQNPAAYISASPATIQQGESALLSWSSVNVQSAHIDKGLGVVDPNGSRIVYPDHTTTYTLTVTGPAGSASAHVTVMVSGNPAPLPDGTFGAQYQYLIPEDATVEAYDEYRFAVIVGSVEETDGTSLSGVTVTLKNHPEYGTAFSNDEGNFVIPVEGGGVYTVVYQKDGFLKVHRNIEVPWKDIARTETIQMTRLDTASTIIEFDGDPAKIVTHQSTIVADEFGDRSLSMVFSGDNQAYAVDAQGTIIQNLTTIEARATEFTTPETMPAILPSNSAFTYCVELSADGIERIVFDKPVITWVDNFLGFDVGELVPAGYYDRDQNEWIASASGVVVRLLDTDSDGIVDALDANGDNLKDDLSGNGVFSDEVKGLDDPSKYIPGATFWRVEVTHFTPWDYNWAFGPPGDSTFPSPPQIPSIDSQENDDCNTPINSYVEARSRILHEDIKIPGTDLTLHYASNHVEGYKHKIRIPASGNIVPGSLEKIIVRLIVAGNKFEQILNPLPNQSAEFIWNGRDSLGNPVTSGAEGRIQIGFAYDGVYQKTAKFGYNGSGNISGSRTRQEVILWKYDSIVIDALLNNKRTNSYFVAEGWTLSNHHYLNQLNAVLHKGDGTLVDNDLDGVLFLSDNEIDQTNGALFITASGVNETKLANIGLYVFQVDPNSYVVDKDFYRYARLFGRNSIPTSILEPIGRYFVNPTSVKCINKSLNVTYSIAKDYHAGGGCYTRNTWSEPTETSHCIYYNNFYWYGSFYDPNYVKDTYNNHSIFYNNHYTPSGSRDFSRWFSKIYQAKTDRIYASLRYGAACLTSLTYNSENNPSYYYGNCEMQTGKEFIIERINLNYGKDVTISEDNGTSHVISYPGRHVKTIDTMTGVALRTFEYDENDRIVSVVDQFGNQTTIERDVDGIPTAIVSPDGIRTELTIDINNNLTHITFNDGSYYNFAYSDGGLLVVKTDPRGNQFENIFDSKGRITDVKDPEDGHWLYNRNYQSNGDIITEFSTGEGNTTTYIDRTLSTGAYSSIITDPTGGQTYYNSSPDGLNVEKTLSCDMSLAFQYDLDSEHGFKYVKEMTERTPIGLKKITLRDKVYQDTDFDDMPDLITETVSVNGMTTTLAHDTLQARKIVTSPEGRAVASLYNPSTLLTESVSIPGLNNTTYGYDSSGRLISIITDARQSTFAYNPEGFLESVTDPENQITRYTYDPVGRVTGISRPDGGSVGFTYDKNGNMTVLTNPVDVEHGFGFNSVNRNSSYQTPLSSSYSYIYDKDRRLIQTKFPSGKSIFNDYVDPADPDDRSRLWRIETPEDIIDFTYLLCGTKVESITKVPKSTTQDTESINYDYDGKLVTAETLAGTLNQPLAYTYNNDFDVSSFTYANGTVSYSYDNDGLLTGAGIFTITRDAYNGIPETVTGGALNLGRTFSGYGEVDAQAIAVSSQNVAAWSLARDNNGRITAKTETVGGVTSNFTYTYDSLGRLLTVTKDGNLVEEYGYDLSGTRVFETNTLRGFSGRTLSYSDEDHLLTADSISYEYDLDGFLITKTDGSDVTGYTYSSRGELLNVVLPDGTAVEYVHDPLGRRIAKKVDGVTVEKYLWQGLTRLLAVYDGTPRLDGTDSLLMRFEYADGRLPVAVTSGDKTYYLTYDQVGSLRLVADSSGDVIKSLEYDSFGNILSDSNPTFAMPFGFAGGLHDRDTGLVRFGYRDYDPDIGRWTAKDPILFAGGDTDLYGYVLNDPVNLIDPLGLEFSDILPGIKKAIVEGTKGGAYAVSEAAKATSDIAMHGHPLAQTALGVALVSEAAPAAIVAGYTASTSTLFLYSAPAIYSLLMGPIKGNPPITVTLREAWKMIEMTEEHYFGDGKDSPCK